MKRSIPPPPPNTTSIKAGPARPKGGAAVMSRRVEPPDSLDFFPTPPWATRAGLRYAIGAGRTGETCWDPACGEGHMSEVLAEAFGRVYASDVHFYGKVAQRVGSFVGEGLDVITAPAEPPDWIVVNPPFNEALEFALRALREAVQGVALLVRSNWSEGQERYRRLFSRTPPTVIAQFVERVPMVRGRWDPEADTATAYSWFVWHMADIGKRSDFRWIPPGCRDRLTMPDDVRRFARPRETEGQASWI